MRSGQSRRRAFALGIACVGAGAGCSLAFHAGDYYGPGSNDGSLDAPAAEVGAASDAADAGTGAADAILDAGGGDSTRDSGPASEAAPAESGPGPGDAADAGITTFCASVDAAFCADFDEGSLSLGWNPTSHSTSDGTLTLDLAVSKSKPGSEHATLPALGPDASANTQELLEEDIPSGWREATLDFDFYAVDVVGNGVVLAAFEFLGDQSVGASLSLAVGTNALQLVGAPASDGGTWIFGSYDYPDSGPTWVHVQIDVLPATTNGKIVFSFDGVPYAEWTGLSFASDPNASTLRLQLGLSRYGNYTPPVDVNYDNVVIRLL